MNTVNCNTVDPCGGRRREPWLLTEAQSEAAPAFVSCVCVSQAEPLGRRGQQVEQLPGREKQLCQGGETCF